MAIPIGQLVIRCNLDWLAQFSGSVGFTVNFPKWVIWVTNIGSVVSRYLIHGISHDEYSGI